MIDLEAFCDVETIGRGLKECDFIEDKRSRSWVLNVKIFDRNQVRLKKSCSSNIRCSRECP